MQETKTYYLYVKGEKVEVSEEIYRAYVQPERRQRIKAYRMKRKNITVTSLDGLMEQGFIVRDETPNIEEQIITEDTRLEEYESLAESLNFLNEKDRQIVEMYFYENKTQDEIAEVFGVSRQYISKKIKEILQKLKKFF